jgi:hypothetical protein
MGRKLVDTDFEGVIDFADASTWKGRVSEVEAGVHRSYLLHDRSGS